MSGRTFSASVCVLFVLLLLPGIGTGKGAGASDIASTFYFRDIGPAVAGGKVTAVMWIAGNPAVIYVGTAGAHVWKSTDGGDSWRALLTHADSASIGSVAIAPLNPASNRWAYATGAGTLPVGAPVRNVLTPLPPEEGAKAR